MNRSILRDMVAYLPARVGPALVALLAIPILTRLLSPEAYGSYLLALTSLSLIGALCVVWVVSVVVRFHAAHSVSALARACTPLLAASIIVGCVLWLSVALVLGPPFNSMLYLAAGVLWLLMFGCFEYLAAWARARNRALYYSLAVCWRSIGTLVFAIIPLVHGLAKGEIVLIAASLAMLPVVLLLPAHTLRGEDVESANRDTRVGFRPLLHYGLFAAMSNLSVAGLSMAPRYVVDAYLGGHAVAIYGASHDIAERSIFFVNAMLLLSSSVMGVQVFERQGEAAASEFLSRLLRIYLIGAVPIAAAIAALAPEIVGTLLPSAYAPGAVVLPLVAAAGVLVGILHRYSLLLSFHKRTDRLMWCGLAALGVNVAASLVFIPWLGLLGSGIATALGYASWLLFVLIAAMPYQAPRFPWLTLVRLLVAAALGAVAMRILAAPGIIMLGVALAVGLITIGGALLLSGEVSRHEFAAIRAAVWNRFGSR